jgi:hypothetical protein
MCDVGLVGWSCWLVLLVGWSCWLVGLVGWLVGLVGWSCWLVGLVGWLVGLVGWLVVYDIRYPHEKVKKETLEMLQVLVRMKNVVLSFGMSKSKNTQHQECSGLQGVTSGVAIEYGQSID